MSRLRLFSITLALSAAPALAGSPILRPPCPEAVVCPEGATCTCDVDGELVGIYREARDPDARTLDQRWMDADGQLESRISTTYDEADRAVETRFYDASNTLTRRDRTRYLEEGRVHITEVDLGADESVDLRQRSRFDEAGHLVEEHFDRDGDGRDEERCVYDPPCDTSRGFRRCQSACEPLAEP